MKMIFRMFCAATLCSAVTFPAVAGQQTSLNTLIHSPQGRQQFSQLVTGQHLPDWVKKGGTETPAQPVTLNGERYQVYYACKPHNCSAEQFALLYSPAEGTMSGVFVRHDERRHTEQLRWLNLSDKLSIDGRTVLYAAITGSLENHPEDFNYTASH